MTPEFPFPTDEDCPPNVRRPRKRKPPAEAITGKGWSKIDNDLHDALFMRDLSMRELRITLCIIRESIGWNMSTTKPDVTRSAISMMTGLSRNHCSTTIRGLIEKRVILEKGKCFRVNLRIDQWQCSIVGERNADILVDKSNEPLVPKRDQFSPKKGLNQSQKGTKRTPTIPSRSGSNDVPKDMKDMKDMYTLTLNPECAAEKTEFPKIEQSGQGGGRRKNFDRPTPREQGTNPRALGTNPRAQNPTPPPAAVWAELKLARSLEKTIGKHVAKVQAGKLSRTGQRKLNDYQAISPADGWDLGPDAWAKVLVLGVKRACEYALPLFRDGPEPASRIHVVIDKAQQFLPDIVREVKGEGQ